MKNSILLLTATFGILFQAKAINPNQNVLAIPDTTQTGALIEQREINEPDTTFSELEDELNELSTENNDTTKIRVGKLKIDVIEDGDDVIIRKDKESKGNWDEWDNWKEENHNFKLNYNKKFKPHWAGFTMGMNSYLTNDFSVTLPDSAKYLDVNTNKSYEYSLNIAQLGIPIIKHRIGIVTGVGFKWNNYKLRNTNVVLKADSTVLYHEIDNEEDYSKSKLTVSYITVPILLEFQVPINDKPLYLSTGIEASLKLGSHTKMKTNDGKKSKDKSDFHVSPLTAALTARIGYDWFGIYGSYNLQQLFKNNEGPELYPFAVGLTINF